MWATDSILTETLFAQLYCKKAGDVINGDNFSEIELFVLLSQDSCVSALIHVKAGLEDEYF